MTISSGLSYPLNDRWDNIDRDYLCSIELQQSLD